MKNLKNVFGYLFLGLFLVSCSKGIELPTQASQIAQATVENKDSNKPVSAFTVIETVNTNYASSTKKIDLTYLPTLDFQGYGHDSSKFVKSITDGIQTVTFSNVTAKIEREGWTESSPYSLYFFKVSQPIIDAYGERTFPPITITFNLSKTSGTFGFELLPVEIDPQDFTVNFYSNNKIIGTVNYSFPIGYRPIGGPGEGIEILPRPGKLFAASSNKGFDKITITTASAYRYEGFDGGGFVVSNLRYAL